MRLIIYLVFLLLLFSCDSNTIEGYTYHKNGFYFKLLGFGDNDKCVQVGNYITCRIIYSTTYDSVFFDAIRTFRISEPLYPGSIEDCFLTLKEGDSAAFLINADNFFYKTLESPLPSFILPNSLMKIIVKIYKVKTFDEYKKDKEAFLAWIEDFSEYEKIKLKQYLSQKNLEIRPYDTAIYKILVKNGNGKSVENGDTITIDYEGYFLNGKMFDSTKRRKEPFSFVYGTEWQVIKGIEKALLTMTEGEKSIFIIPSPMAFGKEGSSSGIIPPYSSVIFEIELLKVNKSSKQNSFRIDI